MERRAGRGLRHGVAYDPPVAPSMYQACSPRLRELLRARGLTLAEQRLDVAAAARTGSQRFEDGAARKRCPCAQHMRYFE